MSPLGAEPPSDSHLVLSQSRCLAVASVALVVRPHCVPIPEPCSLCSLPSRHTASLWFPHYVRHNPIHQGLGSAYLEFSPSWCPSIGLVPCFLQDFAKMSPNQKGCS